MELEELLRPLRLDQLADEWVREVWDSEFMDEVLLPSVYETFAEGQNHNDDLLELIKYLRSTIQTDTPEESSEDGSTIDSSWKSLVTIVNHEKLIALLFFFINRGHNEVSDRQRCLCAVRAARLYFAMLSIPGSNAYRLYHCQMFIVCLKIFKFPDRLLGQEETFADVAICRHIDSLNRHLMEALEDLCVLVDKFSLKSDPVCLEETLSSLVDLTHNAELNIRLNIDKKILGSICEASFRCLHKLIESPPGTPDEIVITGVFKFLLPKFIADESKNVMHSNQKAGLHLIKILLTRYKDAAIDGCVRLIQHLCCDAIGFKRAENRSYRVNAIIGVMALLPLQLYVDQCHWIVKLAKNDSPNWRLLALDVIGYIIANEFRNIIATNEINDEGGDTNNETNNQNDYDNEDNLGVSASSELAKRHGNAGNKDLLNVVVERCQDVARSVRNNALAILVACTLPDKVAMNALIRELFGNGDVLLNIAEEKLEDERVIVRRTAIKLLDNLFKTRGELLVKKNLQLLVNRCRDTSIQVRTLAINTLTGLARMWGNPIIAEAWLDGAMNQLSDPESKIQSLVLNALNDLLLVDLLPHNSDVRNGRERSPWILLSAITRKNMRRHLSRACLMFSNQDIKPKPLTLNLVSVLSTHIGTENNLSCWVLLSCVARYIKVKDIKFVMDYYNEQELNRTNSAFGDIRLLVLVQEVLCEWCTCLDNEQSKALQEKQIDSLQYNTVPSGATRGAVCLAIRLTRDENFAWATSLMRDYENRILFSDNYPNILDNIGGGILVAMADIALAAPEEPSHDLISLLIILVNSFDTDNNSDLTTGTRAAAVAALGKLSLRLQSTAEKTTKLCARLLSSQSCPLPLKINAMCVLADISIRYTSVVEPMLPGMYVCIASPDLTIRRMAVQLITQLLLSGFLKLRNALYFNYFSLVCDEDEKIKDTAVYYLFQCLATKEKNILYNNFVKSVFYYNNFNDPHVFKDYDITEEERSLFSLHGDEKRANRHTIYDMMLTHMTDLQRLNTQVRLCNQAVVAGELGIGGTEVLRDALDILRKLSHYTQSKEQNNDLATRVAINIVTQKMKLNDIEKVVPLVMRLYRQLKLINSPLVKNVVGYACDLLKDYRQEIEEVIDTDVDLLEEIKKYKKTTDD